MFDDNFLLWRLSGNMLRVLINAYACSPDMGSEPGMAWNWCVHLAKHCELHIITEGEFCERIEAVVPTLPQGKNMHFYYNPIGGDNVERCEKIRRMCWNQGDWRFYKYYRDWQWKTYLMAKEICSKEKIDILHQLNMIGFREPGYLWKLSKESGIKFVWGPVGGIKLFPMKYVVGGGLRMRLFMAIKNALNILQLRYHPRVSQALRQASCVISSIPDSCDALKRYKNIKSLIIPETGCFTDNDDMEVKRNFFSEYLDILWVGKFDFRKRLDIALGAIAGCGNPNIRLAVYGTGNELQVETMKRLSDNLGISGRVQWMGNKSNDVTQKAMRTTHLLLFTSVSEDTSTVVMEAISNRLPVLCFDTCGMGYVINDMVGKRVTLSNPEKSVEDFARIINHLYDNRSVLEEMSENCSIRRVELSWENKALAVLDIYKEVLGRGELPACGMSEK